MQFEYMIEERIQDAEYRETTLTWLNRLGNSGWELVHVRHMITRPEDYYYFKRRKSNEA